MTRKKARRSFASNDFFRLLGLKQELQSDSKVIKVIVDEVGVLRLCRSLGMSTSSRGDGAEFELGKFDPSEFDADFGRFIRDKLVTQGNCDGHHDSDHQANDGQFEVGCLFGKQVEVKAELDRMGYWSRDCENLITDQDQGVYCLECGNQSTDGRRFLVFSWLRANLFGPETIRETPAYVLRFLLSVSSNITCCLSRNDYECVKHVTDAGLDSASMRWQSCSVQFQVKQHMEQSDCICYTGPVKAIVPHADSIKTIQIVSGVFPAIAVESATPSVTEWVSQDEILSCVTFADWLLEKHADHAVELVNGDLLPVTVRDCVLIKFGYFPQSCLDELQVRLDGEIAGAKQSVDEHVECFVQEMYITTVEYSRLLFAIPCPPDDLEHQLARQHYDHLLEQLNRYKVMNGLNDQICTALTLPGRLQSNLELLADVFEHRPAALEEVVEGIETDSMAAVSISNQSWLDGYTQSVWSFIGRAWSGTPKFKPKFRRAMERYQLRLQNHFLQALPRVMPILSSAMQTENLRQRAAELRTQLYQAQAGTKNAAFEQLRIRLLTSVGRQLRSRITIRKLTFNKAKVNVEWRKEVEKVPSKVIRLYDISSSSLTGMALLGTAEFDPGMELIKIATVKTSQVVAILVKDCSTVVRRIQFDVQADRSGEVRVEQHDVRTFPHACSLCSIRAQDRRVAFVFGENLGKAAVCRFNDAFTRIDVMRNIELDTSFSLTAPLMDILLTERLIYAVDVKGDVQSYDVRSHQTSKKTSLGKGEWIGGLMNFADELVVGRASVQKDRTILVNFISSDDHRELPNVIMSGVEASTGLGVEASTGLGVGCAGNVLYVLNAGKGEISAYELNVTVRSDAFRIQRSGNGFRPTPKGRVAGKHASDDASEHWLRVFYHVFEKFPVRCLVDQALLRQDSFPLDIGIIVSPPADTQDRDDIVAVCKKYFHKVMVDIRRLNKPLFGLDLTKSVMCRHAYQTRPVRQVLTAIVSFVPVQICRAEDNLLNLLQDGKSAIDAAKSKSGNAPSGSNAAEIAQSIRFGLLSPLVESWNGRCVVVTSMGKQSTGKSYFLNHLTGTTFAIAGSRCTDGVWMSVRFLSSDILLVVLDFEGLGSFERSEQEDVFLSVLNASVSQLTVFRMDSRFDKDVDSLFSRFQKGVQLLKKDPKLFRGLLLMSVKDVNMNDRQGVVDELSVKLDLIFEANKAQNFLTEMYAGQLVINCTPPFGTVEYYQSMENDVLETLCQIVSLSNRPLAGFATGKVFLDCLRLVLSKISILDWTSMGTDTEHLLIVDAEAKLPGILRTGCHVAQSLVTSASIPFHLKEDVVRVGSSEKIVILMEDACQAYPEFAPMWRSVNDLVALDDIKDESLDFGFDVTMPGGTNCSTIQRALVLRFQHFLTLRGKKYDSSKLSIGDQLAFDTFLGFTLRRRTMKVERWLKDLLDDESAKARAQLEQRYIAPFKLRFARCQHRCARCQLGCMRSVIHTAESQHDCSTKHKCLGFCEYDECTAGPEEAPACSRCAGHEGKCECRKGDHSCGQKCTLARAPNCDKTCSLLADHLGDHRCSVQVHVCGAICSAATCKSICLLDIQRKHSIHKCAEVRCLHPCLMKSCEALCCEKNHFHGQATESRAFAIESGMSHVADVSEGSDEAVVPAQVTHICDRNHVCGEMCTLDGICEQKVHIKKSSRTFKGSRGSFEYIHQEMNGSKKRCKHVIAAGKKDHEGFEHSCAAQSLDDENGEDILHFCDVRCPCCSYYCNKDVGHMGLHDTSHGNMRSTYFLAKDTDIEVRERKYKVGESGTAEMCNLFCAKMGRGHVHYLSCEGSADERCVYAGGGASIVSQDQRRHCTGTLYPVPERAMDELLHAKFWSTIGWADPCNDNERALFAMCRFQCNAPEHEEEGKLPSYCVLEAWHQPEIRPEEGDEKFAYIDGHKFECVHAVDSGRFHNVFVLDSSGSMSGQPWQDLLYACNEFVTSRLKDGGEDDLVSFVTFDHESRIFCEKVPLHESNVMDVPFSGGGTSFEQGLRAANEVLSRNDFKEYKATLIFFSDGQPWDFHPGVTIAKHIHSMYAKYDLKAFVVGFGRMNLSVLQRVADGMGGEYRLALDSNALRTEFNRIVAVLCGNEASLALQEPKADGG